MLYLDLYLYQILKFILKNCSILQDYMCLDLDQSNLTTHLAINGKSLSVVTNYFPELLAKVGV